MRKLLEKMSERLRGFLEQRRSLTLVVRAGPSEFLPLVSTLNGLEEESPDSFWLFLDPFKNQSQYVKAVVESFQSRYVALAPELRKLGHATPDEVPARVTDQRLGAVPRLRALCEFARTLLLDLDESHLVVALLPTSIDEPFAFAQLVVALTEHELPVPWCHHMRFVVREEAQSAPLREQGQRLVRTEFYAPDLGQEAMCVALEEEANDESLALPRRMQALLLLAGMDFAHRRLPEALAKYGLLAKYHQVLGPAPLYALSLNGMGEVFERSGRTAEARAYYEKALVPALEAKSPPALVNITTNLANLHRATGNFATAFEYYLALSSLAKGMCNAELQMRCLEQMGLCQHKLGNARAAWEHWQAGVTLARGMELKEHLLDCLLRVRVLYEEAGVCDRRGELEAEIAELERQGVRPYPT